MSEDILLSRLMETLVNGDRPGARNVVRDALDEGLRGADLLSDLYWPAHESLETLHRHDQITRLGYNLGTRLLRMLIDQAAGMLPIPQPTGTSVLAACGPSEGEELGAQIAVSLLEAAGCPVVFAGGGLPADELLNQVHERRPGVLLMFATSASDLPGIRAIVDRLREIGASNQTRIIVGAGVFNRAEGLAEEIGADNWAYEPAEVVDLITRGKLVRRRSTGPIGVVGKPEVKVRKKAA